MSMKPPTPAPGHEDAYPEDEPASGDDALTEVDSLDGPEAPGTIDPFQDADYLAAQLPGVQDAHPGSGADAPSEDEDRFNAG